MLCHALTLEWVTGPQRGAKSGWDVKFLKTVRGPIRFFSAYGGKCPLLLAAPLHAFQPLFNALCSSLQHTKESAKYNMDIPLLGLLQTDKYGVSLECTES